MWQWVWSGPRGLLPGGTGHRRFLSGCSLSVTGVVAVDPVFSKIDCLSLPVPDLDEALRFYQHALGHELLWRDATAAGLRLPQSNAELVLHLDKRPLEVDLAVESVPQAIECFCRAGGSRVAGPFPIRIGLCAVVRDPWGNELVILDTSAGRLQTDAAGHVTGNLK